MSNIQIFVSHRIDIDSELIPNPPYIPVRCGAVFDSENPMKIQGDNIGDHISERRMSFCEFTVQYWAWKNAEADYYGLCHYRRYLSFAERRYKADEYNMVYVPSLMPTGKRRFGLSDSQHIAEQVSDCDGVISEYADVANIPTPAGKKASVREMWDAYDGVFLKKSVIDLMFYLIEQMSPLYLQSAHEYFSGDRHRGFNCFVLKKELFQRLCQFQFPILFELERRLDTTGYSQTMLRTPAFIGEMLYGIFLYHITTYESWKLKEVQLVFFANTDRIKGPVDLAKRYMWYGLDRALRVIVDPIMPKGSRRRETVKNIFYHVCPIKRRGAAVIR